MTRFVALLRGINVGSTRTLPMANLRAACAEAGLGTVATYIQSGNLALGGTDGPTIEAALETLIRARFRLDVPVIARRAADWRALIAACPLPDAARDDPRRTVLLVSKHPPAGDAIEALAARARHGERIAGCGTAILIHYPAGQADTKLTQALVDRLVGSATTARNWTTVLKLADMAVA